MHQDPAGLLRSGRRRGAVGSPTAGLWPGRAGARSQHHELAAAPAPGPVSPVSPVSPARVGSGGACCVVQCRGWVSAAARTAVGAQPRHRVRGRRLSAASWRWSRTSWPGTCCCWDVLGRQQMPSHVAGLDRGLQPAGPASWLTTGTATEPGSQDRQQVLKTRTNATADTAAPRHAATRESLTPHARQPHYSLCIISDRTFMSFRIRRSAAYLCRT